MSFNKPSSSSNYVSDYPEVFFTDENIRKNNIPMQKCSFNQQPLFNNDILKNILPYIFNSQKNTGTIFDELLNKFNPQLLKLFSTISNNKSSATITKKTDTTNIIDVSEYNEIK